MSKAKRTESDGARIIRALTEVVEALERGEPLEKRFTVHTYELPPAPTRYSPDRIRATRELVGLSEPVFASLMGVSGSLVEQWEQGKRKPSRMACRLLDEINRAPKRWASMVTARRSA